jgi:hypothetical protein
MRIILIMFSDNHMQKKVRYYVNVNLSPHARIKWPQVCWSVISQNFSSRLRCTPFCSLGLILGGFDSWINSRKEFWVSLFSIRLLPQPSEFSLYQVNRYRHRLMDIHKIYTMTYKNTTLILSELLDIVFFFSIN